MLAPVSSTPPVPVEGSNEAPEAAHWPILRVRVPPEWKIWLEEAAAARGLAVAQLVRQCIRNLMITRHEQ